MTRTRMAFKDLLKATAPAAMVVGQEPGNISMTYPAIRYETNSDEVFYADNIPYEITDRYAVTCIEEDPNTPIAKLIRQLPMCAFNRFYVADNLNHTVYNIYF